jgi:hypothetical protein
MVRIHPDPPTDTRPGSNITPTHGAIAQLGERLLCKQEVTGSIPVGSTRFVLETARRVQREGFALHSAFCFIRLLFKNLEETRRVRLSNGRTHLGKRLH